MRIFMQTDLEGVAGVRNFADWTSPENRYYETGRSLLTAEINAAIEGLFAEGASYIMIADSHGPGAVDITLLDPRAELMRWGWPQQWPTRMEDGFDYLVFVGQHAMSRTPCSNMAHTGNCGVLEESINGIAVGEFGRRAFCASELGIRTVFATGEQALGDEAQALIPGIETVVVKRGIVPGRGDECTRTQYAARNSGAIHVQPEKSRQMIREGAATAMQRAAKEDFGLIPLTPPFRRTIVYRGTDENPGRMYSVQEHPKSVIAAMNQPVKKKSIESDEQLNELLSQPAEAPEAWEQN